MTAVDAALEAVVRSEVPVVRSARTMQVAS